MYSHLGLQSAVNGAKWSSDLDGDGPASIREVWRPVLKSRDRDSNALTWQCRGNNEVFKLYILYFYLIMF